MKSQRTAGLYASLRNPAVYESVQRIMGAGEIRQYFVRNHVRAKAGDRVLDIGCGPAHLREHLPEVDYIGWDPSEAYISQARRNYAGLGAFHVGIFGPQQAAVLSNVDVAIVSAVLHHMDDVQARDTFAMLRSVLKPDGRVVTVDPVLVTGQNPVARILIGLDRGLHVRSPDAYIALATECFGRVTGVVRARSFPPYTHFFMTAEVPRAPQAGSPSLKQRG